MLWVSLFNSSKPAVLSGGEVTVCPSILGHMAMDEDILGFHNFMGLVLSVGYRHVVLGVDRGQRCC